jgi:hypothetical protein
LVNGIVLEKLSEARRFPTAPHHPLGDGKRVYRKTREILFGIEL